MKFEAGTKQLVGVLILSTSMLASAFGIGMQIQKLVSGLTTVTAQHEALLNMKPCRQD